MMLCIQVLIYLLCFTAAIVAVVAKGPVGGLFFYPGPVPQRALELGLTNEATVRKRKNGFLPHWSLASPHCRSCLSAFGIA
jgi:hypothetical protein